MTCPKCGADLYQKDRRESTGGTFISIRCSNPGCDYYDYKRIPVIFPSTTTIAS